MRRSRRSTASRVPSLIGLSEERRSLFPLPRKGGGGKEAASLCGLCECRRSRQTSGLVRPFDGRVKAVLAGGIPAHAVIVVAVAFGADGQHHLIGADRMAKIGP